MGLTRNVVGLILLTLIGGVMSYSYNQNLISFQGNKVRITSNTTWWAVIYFKNGDGDIRSFWPKGKGNHTYEIKGKIQSVSLHFDYPIFEPIPPNPYIKLEVIKGTRRILSKRITKGSINWRSDVTEVG